MMLYYIILVVLGKFLGFFTRFIWPRIFTCVKRVERKYTRVSVWKGLGQHIYMCPDIPPDTPLEKHKEITYIYMCPDIPPDILPGPARPHLPRNLIIIIPSHPLPPSTLLAPLSGYVPRISPGYPKSSRKGRVVTRSRPRLDLSTKKRC